jgi:hypothetical protein
LHDWSPGRTAIHRAFRCMEVVPATVGGLQKALNETNCTPPVPSYPPATQSGSLNTI